MENRFEEMNTTPEESLPVNLSVTGASSNESDNVDSGEEDNGSFENDGECQVKHASNSLGFDSNQSSPRFENDATVNHHLVLNNGDKFAEGQNGIGVEEEEEGDDSDYEEPKKAHEGTEAYGSQQQMEAHVSSSDEEEEKFETEASASGLKCDELINLEEVKEGSAASPHVNLREDDDSLAVENGKDNSVCLSSGDNAEQEGHEGKPAPTKAFDNQNQSTFVQQATPVRSDDILPPTGLAKRMVEQWSNIDAQKPAKPSTNVSFSQSLSPTSSDSSNHHPVAASNLSDAPQYPPNTAKTIAAKFSAGITGDEESQKPKGPAEPIEQLPSQGQARGLIAKFSAMRA